MAEEKSDTRPPGSKRKRSPRYPGVSLEEAVGLARTIWDAEERNAAPVDVILEHWGYSPKSSAGIIRVAALGYYGLLSFEGSGKQRRGRLSELALDILLEPETSQRRLEAVREAAQKPPVHRDVLAAYPESLPSDDTLRAYLLRDLGFTKNAVNDFISQFRDTVEFAGLTSRVGMAVESQGASEVEGGVSVQPSPDPAEASPTRLQASSDKRSMQLPLPGSGVALIETSRGVSEEEWDRLMKVLEAMRPSFIRETEEGEE